MRKWILYSLKNACDRIIDKMLHVETAKCIKLAEHDNVINYMYEPITYGQLRSILKKYPISKEDYVVDVGCGKGRVLVVAAMCGCENLFGVDISKCLIEAAENNLKQFQKRNHSIRYELICMDAKYYMFPPQINKVFFYNPFQLKIFIRIFKSLLKSLEENPRGLTVFLCGAKDSTVKYIQSLNSFVLISQEKKDIYIFTYKMY